jgi:hypothetical protein
MKRKNLKLEIIDNTNFINKEILCDWKLFQYIFFNIYQNAVKFNIKDGKIIIQINISDIILNFANEEKA